MGRLRITTDLALTRDTRKKELSDEIHDCRPHHRYHRRDHRWGRRRASPSVRDPATVAVDARRAASNSPVLTTLAAAVSGQLNPGVNLVDTLNGGQFTVFAPVDAAFAKIDPATIAALKVDAPLLTDILTYHVVPGQLNPSQVVGTQPTAEGATLTVTGTGDHLQVNGANVICGGIPTANATLYLIDTVLLPPAN